MPPRALLLTAAALSALPSPAAAGQDELAVVAGPVAASSVLDGRAVRGWGAGADLRYGIDDAWTVALGGQLAVHPATSEQPRFDLAWATVGVLYAVDVFVLVPYARLDLAGYPTHPRAKGFSDWGLQGAIGVDWRRWPGWALGAELRFHAFSELLPEWPRYISLQVTGSWVYDRGVLR